MINYFVWWVHATSEVSFWHCSIHSNSRTAVEFQSSNFPTNLIITIDDNDDNEQSSTIAIVRLNLLIECIKWIHNDFGPIECLP